MNILFAVQGTGNGHLSRAREFIPHLLSHGQVDLLISGTHAEVSAGIVPAYQLTGLGFKFGTNGGINILESLRSAQPIQFIRDARALPLHKYDLIINDFEPVSALAARFQGRKIIGLSHQAAFLSPHTPRPRGKKNSFAEWVFKNYAPCQHHIAFHFKSYDSFIETPVIRSEIRQLSAEKGAHCTVYLPAYGDQIVINHLKKVKNMQWHVFSKHSHNAYQIENVLIHPINNVTFLQSLSNAYGLLTGGGFESPAEALFLGKHLFVIPMHNQWEQQCNAAALLEMGVGTTAEITHHFSAQINAWLKLPAPEKTNYPNHSHAIIEKIVSF
jgi:uncharacterized protein (TIGR00661 family)